MVEDFLSPQENKKTYSYRRTKELGIYGFGKKRKKEEKDKVIYELIDLYHVKRLRRIGASIRYDYSDIYLIPVYDSWDIISPNKVEFNKNKRWKSYTELYERKKKRLRPRKGVSLEDNYYRLAHKIWCMFERKLVHEMIYNNAWFNALNKYILKIADLKGSDSIKNHNYNIKTKGSRIVPVIRLSSSTLITNNHRLGYSLRLTTKTDHKKLEKEIYKEHYYARIK